MPRRKVYFLVAGLLVMAAVMTTRIVPCFRELKGTDTVVFSSLDKIPDTCWKELSQKKIFFGHQSVGQNIVDGIKDIMREKPEIRLNILETSDPSAFTHPVFAHTSIGRNMDPSSKINEFVRFMDSGLGNQVDIAFAKLCYVDIDRRISPEEVFGQYERAIESLAQRHSATKFMNVTMPLCSLPKSAKGWLKHLVKCALRLPRVGDDNQARERYNKLLTDRYQDEGGVFDLALVESVGPDGHPNHLLGRDQDAASLASVYTDDGCHLNERGRKQVAEQLLIRLAALACER